MMLLGAMVMQAVGFVWIQQGHQDRGVTVTLLLPLLAFVVRDRLLVGAARRWRSLPRRRRRPSTGASARSPARSAGSVEAAADYAARRRRRAVQAPRRRGAAVVGSETRQAAPAAGAGRLPRRRGARRCSSASGSRCALRRCSVLSRRRSSMRPNMHDGAGGVRRSATCCRAWCWRGWPSAASAPHPARRCPTRSTCWWSASRRASASTRRCQRVGQRAGVRAPGAVRRAAADQPRTARRQGARRRRCATSPSAPASTTSRRW